jgi:hypothetical protein
VASASSSGFGFVIIKNLSIGTTSDKQKSFYSILLGVLISAIAVALILIISSYIFPPQHQHLIQITSVLAIAAVLNTTICLASRHFSSMLYFKSNISLPFSNLLLCTFASFVRPLYNVTWSPLWIITSSWILASFIQGINFLIILDGEGLSTLDNYNIYSKEVRQSVIYAITASFKYKFGDLFNSNGSNINLFLATSFLGVSDWAVGIYTLLQKITSIPATFFQQIAVFENVKIVELFNGSSKHKAFLESRKLAIKGFWVTMLSLPIIVVIYKNSNFLLGLNSSLSELPYVKLSTLFLLASTSLPLMVGSVGLLARLLGFEKIQNVVIISSRIVSLIALVLLCFFAKSSINEGIGGVVSLSFSAFTYIACWNLTLALFVKKCSRGSVSASFGLLT